MNEGDQTFEWNGGDFAFDGLEGGDAYDITVLNPHYYTNTGAEDLICTVSNGVGVVETADVTDVKITVSQNNSVFNFQTNASFLSVVQVSIISISLKHFQFFCLHCLSGVHSFWCCCQC